MTKKMRRIKKRVKREQQYFKRVLKMNDTIANSKLTAYQKICRIVGIGLVDFSTAKRMVEESFVCFPADFEERERRFIKLGIRYVTLRNRIRMRRAK